MDHFIDCERAGLGNSTSGVGGPQEVAMTEPPTHGNRHTDHEATQIGPLGFRRYGSRLELHGLRRPGKVSLFGAVCLHMCPPAGAGILEAQKRACRVSAFGLRARLRHGNILWEALAAGLTAGKPC